MAYFIERVRSSYLDTRLSSRQASFQLEADYASKLLHLSLCDLVPAVGRESRVVDTQNLGMCFEVLGEALSGVGLTFDSQVQRPEAA